MSGILCSTHIPIAIRFPKLIILPTAPPKNFLLVFFFKKATYFRKQTKKRLSTYLSSTFFSNQATKGLLGVLIFAFADRVLLIRPGAREPTPGWREKALALGTPCLIHLSVRACGLRHHHSLIPPPASYIERGVRNGMRKMRALYRPSIFSYTILFAAMHSAMTTYPTESVGIFTNTSIYSIKATLLKGVVSSLQDISTSSFHLFSTSLLYKMQHHVSQ